MAEKFLAQRLKIINRTMLMIVAKFDKKQLQFKKNIQCQTIQNQTSLFSSLGQIEELFSGLENCSFQSFGIAKSGFWGESDQFLGSTLGWPLHTKSNLCMDRTPPSLLLAMQKLWKCLFLPPPPLEMKGKLVGWKCCLTLVTFLAGPSEWEENWQSV